MKSLLSIMLISFLCLFIVGCEEDDPVDVHDEELTVQLTVTPDHVHTLSEITYSVLITDHHGDVVSDLFLVEVQRKAHGSDTWRGTELTSDGSLYTGTYTFSSSGEYDIRVVVLRTAESVLEVPYEMPEHFAVGRAHIESGGFRVEFESFPGHIHEGETSVLKFWVKEAEKDAFGNRPPVTGIDATITCTHFNATPEMHASVNESETGVYEASHDFMAAGAASAKIEFTVNNTLISSGEFNFEIAHGH